MKNYLITLFLAILIIAGCNEKKPTITTSFGTWTDYYLIPFTLKGKVKEMKEINYWAAEKDGKIEKGAPVTTKELDSIGSTPDFAVYFDENGITSRYDRLDGENIILSRIATIKEGKCVRLDYVLKDSAVYYVIPEYDSQGKLLSGTGYRALADTLMNKIVLSYDSNGNISKFEYFNNKNQKTGYHLCKSDVAGHILEAKYFDKTDTARVILSNTYDDNGDIISQVTTLLDTQTRSSWDYKNLQTDKRGNVTAYFSSIDNGKYKLYTERTITYY